MMGRSHAVSGALAYAASAPFLPALLFHAHLHEPDALLGSVVCAGAALLPDLDHPDGTIANFLGPLSKTVCRFVAWASGGHRKATHSFLFVALTWAGTWAGVQYLGRWFTLSLVFLMMALGLKALNIRVPGRSHRTWLTIVGAALVGTLVLDRFTTGVAGWLPYAIALGTLTHLIGDCLTKAGVPLLWPHKQRYEIGLIKKTGNRVETNIVMPVMATAAVLVAGYTLLSPNVLN